MAIKISSGLIKDLNDSVPPIKCDLITENNNERDVFFQVFIDVGKSTFLAIEPIVTILEIMNLCLQYA